MRSSTRPSRTVLLCLLWLVAVGLGGPGCRRAVKPDLGPERTVEAGVPAEFGSAGEDAPAVTWDFGDGTPPRTQARISHAYARAGTYLVRALDGTEEVGRVQLTVVPRPVLRAIPAEAPVAIYLPRLAGTVVTLVDFYEQLVGPELARRQLEAAPFLPMVLQSARGDASAVDPEEGFGLFTLPAFEGTVALLGVTDGAAAMDAVLKEFEASGTVVRRQEDGSARIERGTGAPVTLFLDRGYLYLAIPEEEEAAPGEPVKAQAVGLAGAEELRRQIAGFSGAGLSESPALERLRGKVTEGSVYLFTTFPEREGSGFPGLLASLRVADGRAELDGFMASDKPLMEGKRGPLPALLASAPTGPVAAAMVSVPPEELATWVFGAPGSPRRVEAVEGWRKEGIEVEALVGSVRGDVTLLAYFDAPAFYRNFLMNKRPEPRGAVLLEAGLTRSEPVVAALTKVFEGGGWNVERIQEKGGVTRFRARVLEQPLVLTVASDRLSLQAGEALDSRPKGDVGTAMRERFGGGAFGPSHLSVMVDLGRLRAELDAPTQVPGVPQAQLGAAKAFGGALLDQLTPFEHAFLDFAPEEGGARVRGRVVLRTR